MNERKKSSISTFFVALLFELSSCGIQEEEIVKEDKFYNQRIILKFL